MFLGLTLKTRIRNYSKVIHRAQDAAEDDLGVGATCINPPVRPFEAEDSESQPCLELGVKSDRRVEQVCHYSSEQGKILTGRAI